MDKMVFKLTAKMKELGPHMDPDDYAQIQMWERFIDKINEIVECINKHGCDGLNDDTWEV